MTTTEKPKLVSSARPFFGKIKDFQFPEYLAENHPHIINKVYFLWGDKNEIHKYLENVYLMNKSQQGFHLSAFKEIMYLQDFHNSLYP